MPPNSPCEFCSTIACLNACATPSSVTPCKSARFASLAGLSDEALLDASAGRFDALVTCDQSLRWRQNLQSRAVCVLVLVAASNRLADLLPLVPALHAALDDVGPGEVREIGS